MIASEGDRLGERCCDRGNGRQNSMWVIVFGLNLDMDWFVDISGLVEIEPLLILLLVGCKSI